MANKNFRKHCKKIRIRNPRYKKNALRLLNDYGQNPNNYQQALEQFFNKRIKKFVNKKIKIERDRKENHENTSIESEDNSIE